jgi:hypothetical protein
MSRGQEVRVQRMWVWIFPWWIVNHVPGVHTQIHR